jgi:hypothetical protein
MSIENPMQSQIMLPDGGDRFVSQSAFLTCEECAVSYQEAKQYPEPFIMCHPYHLSSIQSFIYIYTTLQVGETRKQIGFILGLFNNTFSTAHRLYSIE